MSNQKSKDTSYKELVENLTTQAERLLKSEFDVAKAELKHSVEIFLKRLVISILAGVSILLGLFPLLTAAILALGAWLNDRYVLASLIVGVVVIGCGALILLRSIREIKNLKVEFSTTKETLQLHKEAVGDEIQNLKTVIASGKEEDHVA